MEVKSLNQTRGSNVRSPIQFRRVERVVLFTDDKCQTVNRRPPNKRATDVDVVVVEATRVSRVGSSPIFVILGRQLHPAEKVAYQLEISI